MSKKQKEKKKSVEFDPDNGTFYEKVFSPDKIKVKVLNAPVPVEVAASQDLKDIKPQKRAAPELELTLTDKNGHKFVVTGKRLVSRVFQYMQPWTKMTMDHLRDLEDDPVKLEATLTRAAQKSKRELKMYFDNQGTLQGIASTLHEQISWSKIRSIVENSVKSAFGKIEMPKTASQLQNRWTYSMPIKDDNVSAHITVDAGNNIIKGRSGIRVYSRFRTEAKGPGGAPACLNWCGMWQVPLQVFGLKTERLPGSQAKTVEDLSMLEIHMTSTVDKFDTIEEELVAKMKTLEKAARVTFLPLIKESRKVVLEPKEMEAILNAYAQTKRAALPKYIIDQILANVEENTVWGLSQAVSWCRTHGQFDERRAQLPREERGITQVLESISGEIISITPTILKLKKVLGAITEKALTKPQEVAALKPMLIVRSAKYND
jgi:hypothetical protein